MISEVQQTVQAALYASGNAVGGKITLTDIAAGLPFYRCAIVDVVLIDKAAQAVAYELLLFGADLEGTVVDRTPYVLHANDRAKCLGALQLGGLMAYGAGGGIISLSNIYKRLSLAGTNGYAVLVTRGAPTFSGTSDVSLRITTERVYA